MQAHIRFLLKRDEDENKKVEKVFKNSVKMTENKINYSHYQINVFLDVWRASGKLKRRQRIIVFGTPILNKSARGISTAWSRQGERSATSSKAKGTSSKKCPNGITWSWRKWKSSSRRKINKRHRRSRKPMQARYSWFMQRNSSSKIYFMLRRQKKEEDVFKKSYARLNTKAELEQEL